MKSVTKLKDEARKHEQREEWDRAIQLYQQVLRTIDDDESAGESELPLFNRIGDLYVRLGKPADAVKNYEAAADRYAEAGLYNNAIALCNKALRYQPARLGLFRKLGQYCAHQGFVTDARRWYLEFADRMFKQGEIDEAFAALDDFASISDDPEARLLLGRKFVEHDRGEEAVEEYRRAFGSLMRSGDVQAADAVRAELLEAIPDAPDLAAEIGTDELRMPSAGLPTLDDATDLPTYADEDPAAAAAAEEGEGASQIEGFEGTRLDAPEAAEVAAGTLAGLDTGRDDTLDRLRADAMEDAPTDGGTPDAEATEESAGAGLPLLGDVAPPPPDSAPGHGHAPSAPEIEPAAGPAPAATAVAEDEFIDLADLLAPDEDKVETTRFFIKESEPTGDEDHDFAELLNQFRAKLAEHVPENDAGSHYDLGLAFKDMGLVDDAISEYQVALRAGQDRLKVFEELGQCFILKEQYNIAVKVLTRALQFDRRDELELIGVYYFLGRAYEELGDVGNARDAYERVMGLDIRFEDVQERIARL